MDIRVDLQANPYTRGYDIWITAEDKNGELAFAKPILLDFVDPPIDAHAAPTIRLNGKDADSFLTSFAAALARAGFKSDDLKHIQIRVSAIKCHVEDLWAQVCKEQQ